MLDISLKQVQLLSVGFLVVLTGGSWLIMSWSFAQSVLIGGVIAIASFFSGHRDIASFLRTFEAPVEAEEGEKKEKKGSGKSVFIIKFWLRLALIAVILLFFIKSGKANVIGLLLGLSTVVFAIILTTVSVAGRYFLSRKG